MTRGLSRLTSVSRSWCAPVRSTEYMDDGFRNGLSSEYKYSNILDRSTAWHDNIDYT